MGRYIDAERLKQILEPKEWGTPDERWIPEHEIGAMLDYFPAADVQEVRHGRWLHLHLDPDNITGHTKGECSICGKLRIVDNYCPNCGAKMDEVEQE